MSQFTTSSLSGSSGTGSSWEMASGSGSSASDSEFFRSSEFRSDRYFSSPPCSSSKDYCPYSLRQTQLSINYQYDVLLVYDPDENSFYVDKLLEYLAPQNLKIFDFVRDSPPGLPQRKILQSALQSCRYTCIVITKKFISNFWLQLKADMSIEDMLNNENKMYSVIVVVMDVAVKREHLPLDLVTLSPLFCSEKFFENRIRLAFSKEVPFPMSVPTPEVKMPSPVKESAERYSRCNTAPYRPNSGLSRRVVEEAVPAASVPKSPERFPQEHIDCVTSSSILSSQNSLASPDASAMQRTTSITVGSTGSREPQESSDPSLLERVEAISMANLQATFSNMHSLQPEHFADVMADVSTGQDSVPDTGVAENGLYRESLTEGNFFSLSSCKENQPPIADASLETPTSVYHNIPESIVNKSDVSTFSDLEISADSVATAAVPRSESATVHPKTVADTVPSSKESHSDPPEMRVLSLGDVPNSDTNRNSRSSIEGSTCMSLPTRLQQTGTKADSPKRSQSVLSLGQRIIKLKSSFSFRKKKH